MLKTFLQKAEEWLLNLAALLFFSLITAVFVCLFVYPAFSCTFLALIFLTVNACYWGYLEMDFLGMAMMPYLGLSTFLYLGTFAGLHYLNWKGDIAFEVGWLVLGATAIIASLVTFLVCLAINYPRR